MNRQRSGRQVAAGGIAELQFYRNGGATTKRLRGIVERTHAVLSGGIKCQSTQSLRRAERAIRDCIAGLVERPAEYGWLEVAGDEQLAPGAECHSHRATHP